MSTPTPHPDQIEAHAAQGYSLLDVARLLGVRQKDITGAAYVDAFNEGAKRWRENGSSSPQKVVEIVAQKVLVELRQKEMTRAELREIVGLDYGEINLAIEVLETQLLVEMEEDGGGTSYFRATGMPSPVAERRKAAAIIEVSNEVRVKAEKALATAAPVTGRPKIAVDLVRMEELLADPNLSMADVADKLGINRNTIYQRKDHESDFKAAYDRGLKRREEACRLSRALPPRRIVPDEEEKIGGAKCHCGRDAGHTGRHVGSPSRIPKPVCVDCGKPRSVGSAKRCRDCFKAKAAERAASLNNGHVPQKSSKNITETITNSALPRFGTFCTANCDPPTVGHHKDCAYWKQEGVTLPETSMVASKTSTAEVYGGVRLREEVQIRVEEMASWPAERITEFFEALAKVVEIPQQPVRKTIKKTWPKDFEDDSEEGMPSLTLCYLMSLLHDSMEQYEKDAVWTLALYIKRIQAAVELSKSVCSIGN